MPYTSSKLIQKEKIYPVPNARPKILVTNEAEKLTSTLPFKELQPTLIYVKSWA